MEPICNQIESPIILIKMICKSLAISTKTTSSSMITLILHVVLLSTQHHGATPSFSEAVVAERRSFDNNDDDGTTLPAMIPLASPDCWLGAFKSLDGALQFTPGGGVVDTEVCTWMAPDHQKILALELARCHLKDLGRSLTTTPPPSEHDDSFACSDTNLSDCLTNLTDIGVTTYTQFFSYVNQLCVRLLQEVVIDHFHTTSYQLAKSSELAEERLQHILQDQETLWHVWTEREQDLSSLHEHVRSELLEQSDLVTSHVLSVQSTLRESEEKWLREQEDVRKQQAKEFEEQQQELQRLSEVLKTTQQAMSPWYNRLHSLVGYAMTGYAWLQRLLFFLPMTCLVTLTTFPKRLRWMRFYMMTCLIIETSLEIYVQETGDAWMPLSFEEFRTRLQYALFSVEAVFYVLGLFTSLCFGGRSPRNNHGDASRTDIRPEQPHHQRSTPYATVPLADQEAFFRNLQASRAMFEAAAQRHQQEQARAHNPHPPPTAAGTGHIPTPPSFNSNSYPNLSSHFYSRSAFSNGGIPNFGGAQAANNPYFAHQQQPWMSSTHPPFWNPNGSFQTPPMNTPFAPRQQAPWVSPSMPFQSPPQRPSPPFSSGANAPNSAEPFEDIDTAPVDDIDTCDTKDSDNSTADDDSYTTPFDNNRMVGQKRSFDTSGMEADATTIKADDKEPHSTKRLRFDPMSLQSNKEKGANAKQEEALATEGQVPEAVA
jgi:hypothetical protein